MFYLRVIYLFFEIRYNYMMQLQRYLLKCKVAKKYRKKFFCLFLMHKTSETKKKYIHSQIELSQ